MLHTNRIHRIFGRRLTSDSGFTLSSDLGKLNRVANFAFAGVLDLRMPFSFLVWVRHCRSPRYAVLTLPYRSRIAIKEELMFYRQLNSLAPKAATVQMDGNKTMFERSANDGLRSIRRCPSAATFLLRAQ